MLRKVDKEKLLEYESHLYSYILINEMWIEWVCWICDLSIIHNNEMWIEWVSWICDLSIIHSKNESGLCEAEGGKTYIVKFKNIFFWIAIFKTITSWLYYYSI